MTEPIRVTDQIGVIGVDATEYDDMSRQTTIETDLLKQGIDLLETLGWDQVDIVTVFNEIEGQNPLLLLRPPIEPLFAEEQAAIAITPRTEKGRDA